eukprot:m.7685 g.7685  ORF g.7685 m.7685 type:complete len:109 (+) comp5080_c0_seq1:2-328(+)
MVSRSTPRTVKMAQGCKKIAKQAKGGVSKPTQMKKGARYIAPKKTNAVVAMQSRKKLEKAIVSNIEQEIAGRAKAQDQNLKIVNIKLPEADPSKKKTTGKILKGKVKA